MGDHVRKPPDRPTLGAAALMRAVKELVMSRRIVGARVAYKQNANGEHVVAIIFPAQPPWVAWWPRRRSFSTPTSTVALMPISLAQLAYDLALPFDTSVAAGPPSISARENAPHRRARDRGGRSPGARKVREEAVMPW
jgi:hypothetical protein